MMKRIGCLVTALCFVMASGVVACDKHQKAASTKVAKVSKTASAESGCPFAKKEAQTVAAKSDKPCCSKGKSQAKTVASAKSGCSKSKAAATTVAAKSDKPCCSKGKSAATTVASKSGKSGCSKSKTAALATAKSSKSGCSKSKAATVASAGKSGCSKPCGSAKGATLASSDSAIKCPMARKKVDTVLASMPSMKYKVGDTTTCCFTTASTKAAESNSKMVYVVDGKEFHCRESASKTLAKMIDENAAKMRQVSYVAGGKEFHCSKSAGAVAKSSDAPMTYRVAGFDFDCKKKAETVVAKAEDASKAVTVAMTVDGKPCKCAHSAKASGKTVVYQVGDESTTSAAVAEMLRSQMAARTFVETVAASL